ncbi:hypothetical protein OIU84_024463 [Salix udensis]|uniref:Uncharacterized protein n=1 Tax=Salix udensis TaxID=889485 RepID=A0AAD6PBK5_9ROSI|nr:hypothetical protein OIU84_024463 [Salix udensis]
MSFDDISGSIPSNNVFRLMGSSSADDGNPKLCEAPLKPCSASIVILDNKKVRERLHGLCYSAQCWLSSQWHKECSTFMEVFCSGNRKMVKYDFSLERKYAWGWLEVGIRFSYAAQLRDISKRVGFEYIYDWHIFRLEITSDAGSFHQLPNFVLSWCLGMFYNYLVSFATSTPHMFYSWSWKKNLIQPGPSIISVAKYCAKKLPQDC